MAIAKRYLAAFKDLQIVLPHYDQAFEDHAWHLFVIQLTEKNKISRDDFISEMDKRGIGCSVHFIPLHLHPYWQEKLHVKKGDFPNAEKVYSNAVSLPLYTKMTDEDIERVIKTVKEILC